MKQETIIIGSDHAAYQMKEIVKAYLESEGFTIEEDRKDDCLSRSMLPRQAERDL